VIPIRWTSPWESLDEVQVSDFQFELESEVGPLHPIWQRGAKVIGHRTDNDDVVALLSDGSIVVVHLVWHNRIDEFPDEYPSIEFEGSVEEFQAAVDSDSN